MSPQGAAEEFALGHEGATLRGETAGEGAPIMLLHGLTATRRYVVHGSRALERGGHRVVSYDARAHGVSSPADEPSTYRYEVLARDAVAVLDHLGIERAALAGQSMGSATAVAVALAHPDRVRHLTIVTPAHRGRPSGNVAYWDRLADGLEEGGPEGFLAAMGLNSVDERWREVVAKVILQRMARHEHPDAVADALRWIPRSAAFDGMEALARLRVPTLVVGSRDDTDPDHPLAVAEEYAHLIPGARLVVEAPGESPLAWRGGALSKEILASLAEA